MIFRINFKSPDTVSDSVQDAIKRLRYSMDSNELDDLQEELWKHANMWVSGGEYLTIEIDTIRGTAEVVPAR